MKIQLSDHFTYKRLIRFVISIDHYDDLYFDVQYYWWIIYFQFCRKNSICCGQSDPSCCDGCWSDRIYDRFWWKCDRCKKRLVRAKKEKANEYFSMLIFTALIGATILSVFGFIFIRQICMALGARGQLLEYASTYGRNYVCITANVYDADDLL